MPRIAIAGFQHETNSFSPVPAGMEQFEMADSWPGLLSGEEVIEQTRGMNLPIAGFAKASMEGGAEIIPILWCAAEPSGPVTEEAFETITARIIETITTSAPLDGIYLDLHGAMITERYDDGEGELLARLRNRVGPEMPIAVSLDMHANISARMVELADVICIFKTYPHLDMAETGKRAWQRMQPILQGQRPAKAFRQGGYLIPLHAQHTDSGPVRDLYHSLPDMPLCHVELAVGFTAGDVADCGPSIIAYAPTRSEANAQAEEALATLGAIEAELDTTLYSPHEAVALAMEHQGRHPVVLADVQDNPGAGASSDTTGLLRALADAGAQGVILGLMYDPEFATLAHEAGEGRTIRAGLGGRSTAPDEQPFTRHWLIERLDPGVVTYTGEMYGGGVATMGPCCVVRLLDGKADIRVVVTSIRNQCLDMAQFTHFGLDPAKARIICVKSTAHFRADFDPISNKTLCVAAPGEFLCRLEDIQYSNLRPDVRLI